MKKILILLFVLFLSAEVTYGQFAFGLKLGYNASKLSTDLDSVTASFNSGFHVGAYLRFGKRFYIQPEAYYTFSGGTFTGSIDSIAQSWEQDVRIGSLDIPVLLGFKLVNSKAFKLRIMAGPGISFITNSNSKNISPTGIILEDPDLNSVNWFVQAGAGIDFLFLTFDVKYQWGLNNMVNDVSSTVGSTTTTYPVNSKANMFVVSLGFKIL
jgi:hypothetical protein